MRCKACNAQMSDEDCCKKFPPNSEGKVEYSDLCGDCYELSTDILFDTYHEEQDESLCETHGMSKVPGDWE